MFSARSDGFKKRGDNWNNPGFVQSPLHPVCGVSWDDARAFCRWLTNKERKEGHLRPSEEYRLPTDEEWSRAVGLDNETGGTPKEKSGKMKEVYPWGNQWPPPTGEGNFAGVEAADANWPNGRQTIKNYRDNHTRTAPVGSFAPNRHGLHDLSGNVWELCDDWYDNDKKFHVLRGGSWNNFDAGSLLSAARDQSKLGGRHDGYGFRVVVAANQAGAQNALPAAAAGAKPDDATRLKQVKSLLDQGLISKEDHDKKVKEILDSL